MSTNSILRLAVRKVPFDFPLGGLDDPAWDRAATTAVERYWNAAAAPEDRRFSADMLWSDTALYVRFLANQKEKLVNNSRPDLKAKTIGLWDRDVCEIFVAPDPTEPRRYFEFEIAPTGEWVDLAIDATDGSRVIDREYASGMGSAARIEKERVVLAIKVPWPAFSRKPNWGEVWRGNLFRCVGTGPERGYLAWSPTMSETPSFHVPDRFGEFEFVE